MNELTLNEREALQRIVTKEENRLINCLSEGYGHDYDEQESRKQLRIVGNILDKITLNC